MANRNTHGEIKLFYNRDLDRSVVFVSRDARGHVRRISRPKIACKCLPACIAPPPPPPPPPHTHTHTHTPHPTPPHIRTPISAHTTTTPTSHHHTHTPPPPLPHPNPSRRSLLIDNWNKLHLCLLLSNVFPSICHTGNCGYLYKYQAPMLITWANINPSIGKWSHPLSSVWCHFVSIPILWEWISNFITRCTVDSITLLCWNAWTRCASMN